MWFQAKSVNSFLDGELRSISIRSRSVERLDFAERNVHDDETMRVWKQTRRDGLVSWNLKCPEVKCTLLTSEVGIQYNHIISVAGTRRTDAVGLRIDRLQLLKPKLDAGCPLTG